ncbi:MAG: hypothetical protein ABWY82_19670, partial [Tardiphaga sp.]
MAQKTALLNIAAAEWFKNQCLRDFWRRNATLNLPGTVWNGSGASSGWLVGGGIECGFKPHWTVKLEYDRLTTGREAPPSW